MHQTWYCRPGLRREATLGAKPTRRTQIIASGASNSWRFSVKNANYLMHRRQLFECAGSVLRREATLDVKQSIHPRFTSISVNPAWETAQSRLQNPHSTVRIASFLLILSRLVRSVRNTRLSLGFITLLCQERQECHITPVGSSSWRWSSPWKNSLKKPLLWFLNFAFWKGQITTSFYKSVKNWNLPS